MGRSLVFSGDFNVIRFLGERSGSRSFTRAMMEFNHFINDMNLMDIHLSGGEFTWFRQRDRNQFLRIDRFLISTDWDDCFSGALQYCLPKVVSDHIPLLLESGGIWKSPFRFENMWLREPNFLEWIRSKWCSMVVTGNPTFVLAKKLKLLKEELKVWNREVFGKVDVKIKKTMVEISRLNQLAAIGGLNDSEEVQRSDIRRELERFLISEEI